MQAQALSVDGTGGRRAQLVGEICRHIQENPASRLTLSVLGQKFGVSPYHLQRVFVEVMGISPRKYQEECRVSLLKEMLAKGEPIIGALRDTGYSSHSWMYKDSRVKLGMTPANYKAGGAGRLIRYTTGSSNLGRILVAATSHGICSVNVADDDHKLVDSLKREFPNARVVRSDKVRKFLIGIRDHLRGQEVRLPLDLQGTDFQRRVWTAIKLIPLGTTRSYADVARMIGEPRAVRAVANACGSNPVPLIVPCHRVIRSDGTLGGYGLGIPRKKLILETERRISTSKRADSPIPLRA
jgi:AraC family transcriptional regulator, regulatory protein of adaptative response / methylated-DNA-[protein]-cysteine methyltransferase